MAPRNLGAEFKAELIKAASDPSHPLRPHLEKLLKFVGQNGDELARVVRAFTDAEKDAEEYLSRSNEPGGLDKVVAMQKFSPLAMLEVQARLEDKYRPAMDLAAKFQSGRKAGTAGPIRREIERLLTRDPKAKNKQLWLQIKAKAPRGWAVYENSQGQYIEGPKPGQNMSYKRFCNVASEARKAMFPD